jgi:hypothetical protein
MIILVMTDDQILMVTINDLNGAYSDYSHYSGDKWLMIII